MRIPKLNLAFLVDASYELGTGNVFRCLNLAKFLKKSHKIKDIYFFSRDYDYTNKLIIKNKFRLKLLPNSFEEKKKIIKQEVKAQIINLLIVDIPNIDENILREIRNPNLIIVILDSSNKNLLSLVDLIINILPRIEVNDKYSKHVFQSINYWILNTKLLKKNINYKLSKVVQNVLISLGTTDPLNLTKKICINLEKGFKNLNFNLIIGPDFKEKNFFTDFCNKNNNFKCLQNINPSNLYNIMLNSDISFSAGGGTLFELIYIGVPTIIIPNSYENLHLGTILNSERMALTIGQISAFEETELKRLLKELIDNYELRQLLYTNCKKKFNGNGLIQIRDIIFNYIKNNSEKLFSE